MGKKTKEFTSTPMEVMGRMRMWKAGTVMWRQAVVVFAGVLSSQEMKQSER